MENPAKRFVNYLAWKFFPTRWKELHELRYWKGKKKAEGTLTNHHYEHFYTTHFGLERSFYANKVLLDIGCGPRGSLEWASMASRAIGLDPLANEYRQLATTPHRMEYIDSPSEKIPLKDAECDAVFSFNSLDHVEDVDQTLREIKRITRPGGIFLLLVEVNHPPTECEPHEITPAKLLAALKPEFNCERVELFKHIGGVYESIRAGAKLSHPENTREVGYLSARFARTSLPN